MTHNDLLSGVGDGAALEEAWLLTYPWVVHRNVLNAALSRLARRLNPLPTGCPCHTRSTANPLGEWNTC